MIWIGTSGWIYPHWIERFYPTHLPMREHLAYYAQHFPTVEINRSFYRLPTYEQFHAWSEQTRSHPRFRFAVKGSRYLTHMKKLLNAEEGLNRLLTAAEGLGEQLGPFLFQLPPHWHANPERLEQFLSQLPHKLQVAIEVRDVSWFAPDMATRIAQLFTPTSNATLAIAIGGTLPTPLDLPPLGSFGYVRFHAGANGIGLSDDELSIWAKRLAHDAEQGREIYAYFNNDPEACAIHNALRLREMLGSLAASPS